MKTVRINHSNNTQILPLINSINADENSNTALNATTSFNVQLTSSPSNLNNSNNQSIKDMTSTNGSQPQSPPTQSTTLTNGSGLVRRLSVTARPGDIFYKVKDVTESSSTTDTITYDQNETNNNNNHNDLLNNDNEVEQEIIIKSVNSNNIDADNGVTFNSSPRTEISSEVKSDNSNNLGRKTTTWNVKRHQTTSLGVVPPQQQQYNNDKKITKDDASIDLNLIKNNVNNSVANIEPGSPMFTKELLSIR